jgi:PAS domain-containing protein
VARPRLLRLLRRSSAVPAGFEGALAPLAIVRSDGTWVRVNEAACRLLQLDSEELEGRAAESDVAAAASGVPRVWEMRSSWLRGDGSAVRLSVTGRLIGTDTYLVHLAGLPPRAERPAQPHRRVREVTHRAPGDAVCHSGRPARDLCPLAA